MFIKMYTQLDNVDYLADPFDPASLTVPKLRNVLLTHNVDYPSDAKKPKLIELFNDHIVPQAKSLRDARSNVKPSAEGIINVPSSKVNPPRKKVLQGPRAMKRSIPSSSCPSPPDRPAKHTRSSNKKESEDKQWSRNLVVCHCRDRIRPLTHNNPLQNRGSASQSVHDGKRRETLLAMERGENVNDTAARGRTTLVKVQQGDVKPPPSVAVTP
jgi:hypothetical protein